MSQSIPSSAHSNLVSICTTQLKLPFQVTSDLQMGLNLSETLLSSSQPCSREHSVLFTRRPSLLAPSPHLASLRSHLPCFLTGYLSVSSEAEVPTGFRLWTLPRYTLPSGLHWLGCPLPCLLLTLLPKQLKRGLGRP